MIFQWISSIFWFVQMFFQDLIAHSAYKREGRVRHVGLHNMVDWEQARLGPAADRAG